MLDAVETPPPSESKPLWHVVRRRVLSPLKRCAAASQHESIRLLVFSVCYVIFLAPVLFAVWKEYGLFLSGKAFIEQRPALLLPIMSSGGPRFLIAVTQWLVTLVLVYMAFRVLGPKLRIKLHDKTLAKHKDDLLRLLYFGMAMATVGGISTRIEEGVVNSQTGLSFIPLVIAYCLFYTFIFELLKDKDITLSVGLFDSASVPKLTLMVLLTAFVTCVLVLVCLFLTAYQVSSSFFAMYCGVSAVGFALHAFLFLVSCFPCTSGRSFVHVHHWYWSVPLAHMCVFHTDVSMLSQAILLAVHIHGVDCFGVEPLFYDTERRARHPSDFDWILKEHVHEKREYDAYVPNEEDVILVLPISATRSPSSVERGEAFFPRLATSPRSPRSPSASFAARASSLSLDRLHRHHLSVTKKIPPTPPPPAATAATATRKASYSLPRGYSSSSSEGTNTNNSSSSEEEEEEEELLLLNKT